MIKSIKVQLKPNNKQKSLLFQCAGVARFAYNWALAKQEENYKNGGQFLTDSDLRKQLTQLKKTDLAWLYKYSNNITKQAVKDACEAYKKFFKKLADKPKFKSRKRSKPAFYHDNIKLKVTEKHVQLEKIGKVRLAEHNRIPPNSKYSNPRVTFDGLNWWLSVGIETGDLTIDKPVTEPIGIDVGVKCLAVASNGKKYKNINKTKAIKKASKRLKRLQRRTSKHYENLKRKRGENRYKSKNLLKLENKINKTYKRLANIRTNYIHQVTTELVKTKPAYIVIEDLNISGMMKNRHLSKAIAEQKLHEFAKQLEYKCLWYGVKLIKADRFYPSSKLCSCCGHINKDLKLSDRVYKCECGNVIDRDLQAAINLRNYPQSA